MHIEASVSLLLAARSKELLYAISLGLTGLCSHAQKLGALRRLLKSKTWKLPSAAGNGSWYWDTLLGYH